MEEEACSITFERQSASRATENSELIPGAGRPSHGRSILFVYVLAILSNFIFYCSELPLLRLAENKICYEHFGHESSGHLLDPGLEEKICKTPEIQNELAIFIGFKIAFDAVPPLLTSFWYGLLSDRLGRRRIIALACTGELLNLIWVLFVCFYDYIPNFQTAWLAALFLFVGGGQFLLYAMFSLIVVDVIEESKRAQALSLLHSITLLNSLFGAPIAAVLMKQDLKLPFIVIIALSLIRYPIIWNLPETGPIAQIQRKVTKVDSSGAHSTQETQSLLENSRNESIRDTKSVWTNLRTLLKMPPILFCFACFLMKRIAFTSETLMFQHVSELLSQPLDETAWVRIPIGLTATLVLTLGLPLILQYLKREGGNGVFVEVWAVRTSLVILIAGFAIFWKAVNAVVMTIALILCGAGEGLAPSLQAVVSYLVRSDMHSDLFAAISVIETTAKLLGGPIMAGTFAIRDAQGHSYGFCFLLSSTLFSLLWAFSWTPSMRSIAKR